MSRLITSENIAIFEYPECDSPEFDLDAKGVLFISGYNFNFMGKIIGTAKRFETKLNNYVVVGKLDYAKSVIKGDFSKMIEGQNVDTDNCVVLIEFCQ